MKLPSSPSQPSAVRKGSRVVGILARLGRRPSSLGDREGVALVVTLIMLSVITFMAVTFLVLSQRERSSVTTATDQKAARNAADAALSRVSAELLTRIMLKNNIQDFNLMVSTNYINPNGFNSGISSPTNVNYNYMVGGGFAPVVSPADRNQNIANLMFNPRAPVVVVTDAGTGAGEFRYYLDLNRNGRFDRNGNWPVVVADASGNPAFVSTNAAGQTITVSTNLPVAPGTWLLTNAFVGDPEWIGVLERPERPHSADNKFIERYAYAVQPVGKTLDINTIYNQAVTKQLTSLSDGYMRNQGVGPWEINLPAFLVDLNTNIWDAKPNNPALYYQYNEGDVNAAGYPGFNKGLSFEDAFSLLTYRYHGDYDSLAGANLLFTNSATALTSDNIDQYSDGPLMLTTTNIVESFSQDTVTKPWPGAENTNHFFSIQDLFDISKTQTNVLTAPGFSTRLRWAGGSNDSYNAYTFYRLMAQLGTDSSPEKGRLNINFKNTDNSGNIVLGAETNLVAWTAIDFFTNAAAAMFQQMNMRDFNGNLITITNIPFYYDPATTGHTNLTYYTPAVHRILQLAANMFETTTNRSIGGGPTNYPTVFRPVFRSAGGVASIIGYLEVTDIVPAFNPYLEPTNFVKINQTLNTNNIYGVPWVIGAKKGFPNFNEFSMENAIGVSRKLQFTNSTASRPWVTNQIFEFALTNSFGAEVWNSYTNQYGRSLRVVVSNELSMTITNEAGSVLLNAINLPYGNDLTYGSWSGWTRRLSDTSFQVPLRASSVFTNAIYQKNFPFIVALPQVLWGQTFSPRLWLGVQNKLRFILIDTTANRIVDFVNVSSTQPMVDITDKLNNNYIGSFPDITTVNGEWATNFINQIPVGILNQIQVSLAGSTPSIWIAGNKSTQSDLFRNRLPGGLTNSFQAPYSPNRTIHQLISWQANDPLVHYTESDLTSTNGSMANYNTVALVPNVNIFDNLTNLNVAYQPWGGYHLPGNGSQNPNKNYDVNWQVKDPMVEQSDNWDFPTNQLPNIGWLGRIHRGTPWQTIYMKPSTLSAGDWQNWANDNIVFTNVFPPVADAPFSRPTKDYGLFDLFTSSINENASRGRMNVNQTNLAAWSAILSGVNVLTNATINQLLPVTINPAGVYDPATPTPVAAIVNGINRTRANQNNFFNTVLTFPNQLFQHAGDVLATPQLTVASPFLNTNGFGVFDVNSTPSKEAAGINDEVIERIPQQIMGLLTIGQTPRFVIYSYGQSLRPAADHALVSGGPFNGLCTNYQITAETATRAVVRVEGTPDPRFANQPDSQGRMYPPHLVIEQFNVLGPD